MLNLNADMMGRIAKVAVLGRYSRHRDRYGWRRDLPGHDWR
jgi:hypothetical protein